MAMALGESATDEPLPAGLSIRIADDADALSDWGRVCAEALALPEFVADANADFMRRVLARHPR